MGAGATTGGEATGADAGRGEATGADAGRGEATGADAGRGEATGAGAATGGGAGDRTDDGPDVFSRAGTALRATTEALPAAVWGTAAEAAWLATHLVCYPLAAITPTGRLGGLMPVVGRASTAAGGNHDRGRYSLDGLAPRRRGLLVRDVEAAATPVLLVHGLIDNRSVFVRLRRSLHRRGFDRVSTVPIPLYARDVDDAARRLAEAVEERCAATGCPRLNIVAHSLGGLVARYYVQKLGGDERVNILVTLGTPHSGTVLARLVPPGVPHRLLAAVRPDSRLIRELDEPAPGCRTAFVAFAGELDSVVRPVAAAHLRHPDLAVRNITVAGAGHHGLPFSGAVVHEIGMLLGGAARTGAARTGVSGPGKPYPSEPVPPGRPRRPAAIPTLAGRLTGGPPHQDSA
jgi:pimeloyl-ACP methyl ester carboxylesterase